MDPNSKQHASIIIVGFNHGHYLRDCLPAVLQQDHPSYDVIVVDNASSDGTSDFVRTLLPDHQNLRLMALEENVGYAEGNNVGFKETEAEFLVVLNPDTRPEPNWLSELVAAFDDPEVGMATSKIVMMEDAGRLNTCGNEMTVLSLVTCRGLGQPSSEYEEPADIAAVSGAAFAIRRETLEKTGPFDADFFLYYEDTDLSLRSWLAGYRCVYVPTSVVEHDYIFKFTPLKAFWQERNRHFSLLKNLRWRTLLLMSPWLFLGELMAMGYCAMQGPRHVLGKLRAYAWILFHWRKIMASRRHTQASRVAPDSRMLGTLAKNLSVAGAAEGWLRKTVEFILRPLLRLGWCVTRQVTW